VPPRPPGACLRCRSHTDLAESGLLVLVLVDELASTSAVAGRGKQVADVAVEHEGPVAEFAGHLPARIVTDPGGARLDTEQDDAE